MINKVVNAKDILADDEDSKIINGVKIRKGTIAAVLANAKVLSSSTASMKEKDDARNAIIESAPALVVLGLFDQVIWKNPEIQKIVETAAEKLNK